MSLLNTRTETLKRPLMLRRFWNLLFRLPDPGGAKLDWSRAWEVPSAPSRPLRLGAALRLLLSEEGVVALEGVSIHADVESALRPFLIAPTLEISPGTLSSKSKWLHIRATSDALNVLDDLANTFADPEVCDHLYGYARGKVLLEWHDAFIDPIHIDVDVAEDMVAAFCSELGTGPPQLKAPAKS